MIAATITEKGQIDIPAQIRSRYELTPGTQVEFIDEGGVIRLVVRRKITQTHPLSGFGLVKLKRSGAARKLSNFDPARSLKTPKRLTR